MRGNLPGVDPVLCYLVWEPRSPVMWWLDTWDMASDGKNSEESSVGDFNCKK